MGDKEIIDGMKAVAEMAGLLQESAARMTEIIVPMMKSVEGDHAQWFTAIEKVTEFNEDDLAGMVIVACSMLARIKVKTQGTPAYEQIKDILNGKNPEQAC